MSTDFTGDADNFHDTIELPSDLVDLRAAASISAPLEALLDNDAYLKYRGWRAVFNQLVDDAGSGAALGIWTTNGAYGDGVAGFGQLVTATPLVVNDTVLITVVANLAYITAGNSGFARMRIALVEDDGGANASYVPTGTMIQLAGADAGLYRPVTMQAVRKIGVSGALRVKVQGNMDQTHGSGASISCGISFSILVNHFRSK